ncbi:hypothetical protein [Bergeyella porcorum]|uniref:hypothetical protein n=1 Tax=Bergeyella porcorum TaxID=1735111 RepID=UPI002E1CB12B
MGKVISLRKHHTAYNSSNTLQVNSTLNNYRANVCGMACHLAWITDRRNQFKSC